MSALKVLVKFVVLIVLSAAVAGVVMLVKRPKDTDPISFDEWPDVPRNPAS